MKNNYNLLFQDIEKISEDKLEFKNKNLRLIIFNCYVHCHWLNKVFNQQFKMNVIHFPLTTSSIIPTYF